MNIMVVFEQMVILFGMMIVGYIIAKTGAVSKNFGENVSMFILKVSSPALILSSAMANSGSFSSSEILQVFMIAVIMYMVLPFVAVILVKILHIPESQKNLYKFMTVFSNVGFMGYPVIEAIYGTGAIFYASIFNIIYNVFLYTFGVLLMTEKMNQGKPDLKEVINPGIIASAIACVIALFHLKAPNLVENLCSMLGSVTSPLAMVVIGTSLAELSLLDVLKEYRLYPYTIIKQLVLPILLLPLLQVFIKSEYILGITVIIIAMPVATMTIIMSHTYEQDWALAAKGVFITTLASVFTIPFIAALL